MVYGTVNVKFNKTARGRFPFHLQKRFRLYRRTKLTWCTKKSAKVPSLILITSISFIQSRTFPLKIISFLVSHMTRKQQRSTFSRSTHKFLDSMHSSVIEKKKQLD
ncbi:hypothetical protein V6Z11_D07G123500 [Gossypium hirsutum]